jgi:hypothetical protein
MGFDEEQLEQLRGMFAEQSLATRSIVREELVTVNERLDRLFHMESGDIKVAYSEIESLKKRVKKLETVVVPGHN